MWYQQFRRKKEVHLGDIILISLRDFQDDKCDVILKYTPEEARNLKAYGELPENVKISETGAGLDDGVTLC